MPRRAFIILLVLDGLNIVVFSVCQALLTAYPGSGPEGIGTALMLYASVFVSVFLAGFGLNLLISETRRRSMTGRTLLVTLIGAIPFLFFLVADIRPVKFSH